MNNIHLIIGLMVHGDVLIEDDDAFGTFWSARGAWFFEKIARSGKKKTVLIDLNGDEERITLPKKMWLK